MTFLPAFTNLAGPGSSQTLWSSTGESCKGVSEQFVSSPHPCGELRPKLLRATPVYLKRKTLTNRDTPCQNIHERLAQSYLLKIPLASEPEDPLCDRFQFMRRSEVESAIIWAQSLPPRFRGIDLLTERTPHVIAWFGHFGSIAKSGGAG